MTHFLLQNSQSITALTLGFLALHVASFIGRTISGSYDSACARVISEHRANSFDLANRLHATVHPRLQIKSSRHRLKLVKSSNC